MGVVPGDEKVNELLADGVAVHSDQQVSGGPSIPTSRSNGLQAEI